MSQFHIHVDARTLSARFEALLGSSGFNRMDFIRDVSYGQTYAPQHHLTFKCSTATVFNRMFESLVNATTEERSAIEGYIEGEFVPYDDDLPWLPFDPLVASPFHLVVTALPPGVFREAEVHVSMDKERSSPELLASLRNMGLLPAFMPKSYGVAAIFTAQGKRTEIAQVGEALRDYLVRVGGGHGVSIKEERIARWWASSADIVFPPVIAKIEDRSALVAVAPE